MIKRVLLPVMAILMFALSTSILAVTLVLCVIGSLFSVHDTVSGALKEHARIFRIILDATAALLLADIEKAQWLLQEID